MRCIEILASAAGMPVDELMDRIEEDDKDYRIDDE